MKYVYIVANEAAGLLVGPCKIGISRDPEKRLLHMQTANPSDLAIAHWFSFEREIDAKIIERRTHDFLSGDSIRGEWFDVDPKLATEAVLFQIVTLYEYEGGKHTPKQRELLEKTGFFGIFRSVRALGEMPMPV